MKSIGEVAERSIAADCKSAALVATEVRTLPSPPFDSALRASLMAGPAQGRSGWCPERAKRVEGLTRVRVVEGVGEVVSEWAGLPAATRGSTRSLIGEVGEREGGSNSVVESQPSKLLVAGSIPVSRSNLRSRLPTIA
jgi:hypothetical protein